MTGPARYMFEGQPQTITQIAAKCTGYHRDWIGDAVKYKGASCVADLHQLHAESLVRLRRTHRSGPKVHIVLGKGR